MEESHLRAVAEDLGNERGRAFEDELTDGSVAGAEGLTPRSRSRSMTVLGCR
ncbi:hypothetical protein ACFFX0_31640 [Citricoccus parietis]|uniref:Uncharacterized protein n=1 Tax=Citricoccus parietis TaxID=592307 RepID=A0ABV5G975_9MICC